MSKGHGLKSLVLLSVLALVCLLSFSQPARACYTEPGDAWIIIWSDGEIWIIFHSVTTVSGTAACTAGMAINQNIASVNNMVLLNARTQRPFAGFNFTPNPSIGQKLQSITGEQSHMSWQGFFARVRRDLPDGVEADLRFELTLRDGATPRDFVRMFRNHAMINGGTAATDGSLTYKHFGIFRPPSVGVLQQDADGSLRVVAPEDL